MNKKFTKLMAALALLAFMTPSLVGWGQTNDYTISLLDNGTGSDGTSTIGYVVNANVPDYVSITGGAGYVTSISTGYTYKASTNNGWKLSSGSGYGTVTLNLATAAQELTVSKVTINAKNYGTDATTLTVTITKTDNTTQSQSFSSLASDFTNYELTLTSASTIKTINVAANAKSKRAYVHHITVTYYSGDVTYDVTYKANEGTGEDLVDNNGGNGYANGDEVTVKANDGTGNPNFTRTGYDFTKWNTKADGTGTDYSAGNSFSISSNTNLYAQWTKHNYNVAVSSIEDVTLTVTYGANTIAEGNNADVPYGTAVTLAASGLGAGQAFVWSITKTADGTDVTADVLSGTTLTVPDYAVTIGGTVATTYTVTYDCNGGTSGCPENVTGIASGSSITLAAAPTKTNYVFTGWNDGTTTYQAGASYTVTDNVTLTAQWVEGGTGTIYFGSADGRTKIDDVSDSGSDNLNNTWYITVEPSTCGFSQNSGFSQVGTGSSGNTRATSITFTTTLSSSRLITGFSAKFGCFANTSGDITLKVGETTVGSGSFDGTNDITVTNNQTAFGNVLTVTIEGTTMRVKCYEISYSYIISSDPVISAPSTINLTSTDTDNEFAYEIVNPVSGKTLSATTATSWISNISVTSDKVTFTTSENTSETDDRQGSITLSYDGAENKVVTINQGKVDYAAMPFSYTGNGNSGNLVTGLTSNLTSEYTNGWPVMKFDAAGKYLTLKLHEAPASISYDIRPSASSWTGTFKVQTSADGESFTDLVSYTSLSNDTETKTHVDLPSTVRYIRWYFDTKSSGFNVALGNIKANTQYDIYGTVTVASLAPTTEKKCTIYNGGVLTVSNTLTNNTAANLIIEDGGQLITSSSNVAATVKKNIEAYGNDNTAKTGWNFIASPITSSLTTANVVGLVTSATYDLYKYNEPDHMWHNYKQNTAQNNAEPGFAIAPQMGYLYANSAGTTINFVGTVQAGDEATISSLSYNTTAGSLAGFNLVGNPFTYAAFANKPYYMTSDYDGETHLVAVDNYWNTAVMPCTGVLVQVTDNDKTVTFSKTEPAMPSEANQGSVQLTLAQQATNRGAAANIDNAIVSFNEGSQLGKFYFGEQNANLYIPQGTEEYAIAYSNGQGEMPVNFRANENGQYTLTVNPENVEMNYLHLIDNMTGADIDLLAEPSYSFEAKTTDYESRFRLVFVCGDANDDNDGDNANFAFYSNGQYIIANEGEATLQVIDIMGRILSSETINGSVSKSINAPVGVYMLRLINGNDVKVQKMVVR